jgi:hypothetical protein
MERLKPVWEAFKDIAIVFSFSVNFILIVALLLVGMPALRLGLALNAGMVEPMLEDLDAAFVRLGESTIDTTIPINEPIPIRFDLPLDQELPINFQLAIEQNTVVTLQQPVPLRSLPAQFTLPSGGGAINGTVSLSLPAGVRLPIRLSTVVPVNQTIPVQMMVPVSETVPVQMDVPVSIALGEAGLDPAVQDLRGVFRPVRQRLDQLPEDVELGLR